MELLAVAEVDLERNQTVENEELAARCAATTLLITASVAADVERLARRIHAAGVRAAFPFVHVSAPALPTDATTFRSTCCSLLDAATGGSLLITDVEDMPRITQDRLIDALAALRSARESSAAARLIAGTTASLCDCIADGRFSERLFYRLNIIHVVSRTATVRAD